MNLCMTSFFYINADMCELGFGPLSVPYCPLWKGGVLVLGGPMEDIVEHYLLVLYGQYQWWGGEVCSNGPDGGEWGCCKCLVLERLTNKNNCV
jgi:hypothetical protein